MDFPRVGGHAIRPCPCMFREDRHGDGGLLERTQKERIRNNLPTPLGPLWEPFWRPSFELCYFCFFCSLCLVIFVGSLNKERMWSSPRGGDMRSDHACACFVRVGRPRRGSIWSSILVAFCEPSSPQYSILVALIAKTGFKKSISNNYVFGGPFLPLNARMSGGRAPWDTGSHADNIHIKQNT